ncbi:olfactory receptor 5AR1-like [Gastrophryne carolinensis]
MESCQNSSLKEFQIIAFATAGDVHVFTFTVFLLMYVTAVTGNLIIATLICKVSQLHTPMYFFLCNFSIVEAMYVSTILPKLLAITFTGDKRISFSGCITQLYFFMFSGLAEIFLLTCMAYDRYVAICTPLHYYLIMRKSVCISLAAFSVLFCMINAMIFTFLTSTLSFCLSHNINNFFCEIRSLMVLSSSDTKSREVALIVEDICLVFTTFVLICTSYVYIISTISKMCSSKGRYKTFSSCTSHLTTVILFYGPIIFLFIKPKSKDSEEQDKLFSLLYVIVVPTFNPFVYTLRNKDVLGAIAKLTHIAHQ